MNRRLLLIDPTAGHWWLETLQVETLKRDPREDYFVLSGETLCQYLLRHDPGALVIARGPMPFLSGNKASVGYVSPLTGVPHYSFVGGRAAAQLLNLGLDAICFQSNQQVSRSQIASCKSANRQISKSVDRQEAVVQGEPMRPYVVISGQAPGLKVEFKDATELPDGQRSAFYWLLERELGGNKHGGSIFTLGEGARLGYHSANLAVEAIYHAGRGGAGAVFAGFVSALVLRGKPMELAEFFAHDDSPFARNPNATIAPLLDIHCARMSDKTGGTIAKLYATGTDPEGKNTLPARNARQVGYKLADLGGPQVLRATREGQTGCHWCQVDCRHYHWVPAGYAPDGRDMFLDDFEPTYAIFAMLGLEPSEDTFQARLDLRTEVDRRLILPIEEMGCDVLNIGIGLAALFEGVAAGLIPPEDVPDFIAPRRDGGGERGRLETAVQAVEMLRTPQASEYPALRAVGDGPQALAQAYPAMQDIVFTSGKGTLGNAGHANALWTFLMPFSRFFGHYVGQLYKIDEGLPPPGAGVAAYRACFQRVVQRMLQREFFWVLCNALSMCAFTFVIFSQDGKGERLSDDHLLVRLLRNYGIQATADDMRWFVQAFWAQSMDFKAQLGWQPLSAADLPRRVYEALSLALERPVGELQPLMQMLIEEWKRQAGGVMRRFGYEVRW
jgi:aldehyde:ferredoxin oxidoreductase